MSMRRAGAFWQRPGRPSKQQTTWEKHQTGRNRVKGEGRGIEEEGKERKVKDLAGRQAERCSGDPGSPTPFPGNPPAAQTQAEGSWPLPEAAVAVTRI